MASDSNAANEATAQMLSHALGNLGGKQKSWMQAAALYSQPSQPTNVRRQKPLPKKRVSQPSYQLQITDIAQPSIEHIAETQPQSNSTSPQLANIMTRHVSTNQTPTHVTVFPSPTPSDEGMNNAPINAHHTSSSQLEATSMDVGQRTRLASKRLFEEGGLQVGTQNPSSNSRQKRPEIQTNAGERPSAPQAANQTQIHNLPHIPVPPPQLSSDSYTCQVDTVLPKPSPLNSLPQTAAYQPRVPTEAAFSRTNTNIAQVPSDVNPHSSWYNVRECLYVLNELRNSNSDPSSQSHISMRISALRGATEIQDWSYLFMHQFYCLVDFDLNLLPDEVRKMPGLDKAFRLIQMAVDSNRHLPDAVRHFFSTYPYPLKEIGARWPSMLKHQTHLFACFVAKSPFYESFRLECSRRRFPPLAWELNYNLNIQSITFQLLVFTAVLCSIWPWMRNGQEEAVLVNLFQNNQACFYQRIAREESEGRPSAQKMRQDNEADLHHWAPLFRQLIDKAVARHHSYTASLTAASLDPNISSQLSAAQLDFVLTPQPQQQTLQSQPNHSATFRNDMVLRSHPADHFHSIEPVIQPPQRQGRPRTQNAPSLHGLQSQRQSQQQRTLRSLLPQPGWTQPLQRQPHPERFSLHQANLRSPILKTRSLEAPLYHFVIGFLKIPARLTNAGEAVERWTFSLDAAIMRNVALKIPGAPGEADIRSVDAESKTFRLRCVKWPTASPLDDRTWAVTDTSWIPHLYLSLNETTLHQRKKLHYGRDLPIDITGILKQGENVLEITVMAPLGNTAYRAYLMGIEFLGVISRSTLKSQCFKKNRLPAHQVLSDIKRKLSQTIQTDNDDDDLAIVESSLTINLFDPFSASKICDIPIRGRSCLHNDCFDLDTFLDTRPRASGGDASSSGIGVWRCPICGADARPQHLLIDGFLEDVKKQLDAQGLSNTRAIIVQQDGSWKPKAEVFDPNGVSDRGTSDEPAAPVVAFMPTHGEIIDLSD